MLFDANDSYKEPPTDLLHNVLKACACVASCKYVYTKRDRKFSYKVAESGGKWREMAGNGNIKRFPSTRGPLILVFSFV